MIFFIGVDFRYWVGFEKN